jgi:4-diphosphocytidyl-2-C-methyl-D-erythritol kinase
VQTISLHDTLTLESRDEGISLQVDDPAIPAGPENLAWRAAAALPAPRGSPRGAHLGIRKGIPAGAGLGGGSSDAAATLIGLRALWGLVLSDRELEAIAATLGADVPFFLHGGTALLTGTGTVVSPLEDVLGYEILVIFPGVPLATREVYALASASLTSSLKISSMARFRHTLEGNLAREVETWVRAGNDLEPAARSLCPLIAEITDRLRTAGATAASMTGSGSAVFGIFRDTAALERAFASMRASGFAAGRCVPVGRAEFRRHSGLP